MILVLSLLIVFSFWSCEEFQPKDFTISELDAIAGQLLSDSLSNNISTVFLNSFNDNWEGSAIYENVPEILDSLEANEIIATDSEMSYTVLTPEEADSNSISFSTQHSEIVFFSDDYVGINIIDVDGTIFTAENATISLETIAECPEIKARYVYKLTTGSKLLQVIKTDQKQNKNFRLVILPNN